MKSESAVGVYSIKAVEAATGVPASTLRYWEKAHGLIAPSRTAGGHRLYSQDDIECIKWLSRKINDEGYRPSAAHKLLEQQKGTITAVAADASARRAILILVAEKDPITADLEEYFLNKEGYDVHIVLDGRRAVDAAVKLQPDLIILDVILPGISGLSVCKALKANPATAAIPVLVFSVLDVRDRALQSGADAFLLKPIEQPGLIDTVKALLTEDRTKGRS